MGPGRKVRGNQIRVIDLTRLSKGEAIVDWSCKVRLGQKRLTDGPRPCPHWVISDRDEPGNRSRHVGYAPNRWGNRPAACG